MGHLYNLRKRAGYLARRPHWTKTKGTSVSIGERRAPSPDGRPGFIRIDSVHQGDDNGLAETQNGAVVRKHFGYEPIPQHWANAVNALCRDFLNPYLNFHRPCLFPESVTDTQGKTRKRYPLDGVMTPFEKLKSIPAVVSFLKPSITLDSLEIESKRLSDHEAAEQIQQAKQQLFLSIHNRSKVAA